MQVKLFAVAAETIEITKEAIKLVEVEYEELPAVTNALEAMKSDAPLIHLDLEIIDMLLFSNHSRNEYQ